MSWYLNGTDMEAAGFYLTNVAGWWGGAAEQIDSYPVAGSHHALRSSTFRVPPKHFRLQVTLIEPTYTNRPSKIDALELLLHTSPSGVGTLRPDQPGEVELRLGDSTRVRYAVPVFTSGSLVGGRVWNKGDTVLDLDFDFYDPAFYETTSTVSAIGSTALEVELGTYPSFYSLSIAGAATAPIWKRFADAGATVGAEVLDRRITLTGNVAGGSTLVLDQIRQLPILNSTITMSYLPPGSGYFYPLERTDGFTACWVSLSSGTGTLTYRKRWR